jgi:arsenate reductase
MTQTIIFLCPHAAAKSVIAAAYFNRIAKERGLDILADAAGTEPQELVSPAVVKLLSEEGLDVSQHKPRRVSELELKTALRVVSLGCALEDLTSAANIEDWSDVPPPSQDLLKTRDAIAQRLNGLLNELQSEL